MPGAPEAVFIGRSEKRTLQACDRVHGAEWFGVLKDLGRTMARKHGFRFGLPSSIRRAPALRRVSNGMKPI
jgi:hypothetical protein